jgi:hypothetical protein
MSIRLPLQTVLDKNYTATTPGTESVAGVVPQTFILPQDTDGVVMKIQTASISGSSSNVNILFQTTDDGGTTWYDVARSQAFKESLMATSVINANAVFIPIPVTGFGFRSQNTGSVVAVGSVIAQSVMGVPVYGPASTLAVGAYSGVPILGQLNRICLIYTGATTTNDGVRVKVMVNSQSATA